MNSNYIRRCVLSVLAFASLAMVYEAQAKGIFGARWKKRRSVPPVCCPIPPCEPRGSCICVIYKMMDLGTGTQIYYAHEHDACGTAPNCQYFDEVWHSGSNLVENEDCLTPGSCDAGGSKRCGHRDGPEPALDHKKAPGYNLYNDADALAIATGLDVRITEVEVKEGTIRIGMAQPRYVKVFIMKYKKGSHPEREFAIGIETTGLLDPATPDFTERAEHYQGPDDRVYKNLYEIEIDPGQRDCLIIATP